MSDRLTQLQVCLNQLIEQFNSTVNYVNVHSEPALLDEDPMSVTNMAVNAPNPGQQAPPPGQAQLLNSPGEKPPDSNSVSNHASVREEAEANFENTINELSTDIILKSRQISMLIDSLPGIGTSPDTQLVTINELIKELDEVEQKRIEKIEEKDKLLAWCETLIKEVASGISETRS